MPPCVFIFFDSIFFRFFFAVICKPRKNPFPSSLDHPEMCRTYAQQQKGSTYENTTATTTPRNKKLNEQKQSFDLHVRFKSWYISLPSYAEEQRELTKLKKRSGEREHKMVNFQLT